MADESKETKPRSFRINDETADKFKEITNSIGGNQQEALARLIEAYEFQTGKRALPNKKADIEQFEGYITAITRMYMGSLEDNQNLSEIVHAEYDALLKSKDITIQKLQQDLATAKRVREEAVTKAKVYADENIKLNNNIDDLNKDYRAKIDDLQTMLADKDKLNNALKDSCNDLKSKVREMENDIKEVNEIRRKHDDLRVDYEKVTQEKAQYAKTITDFEAKIEKMENDIKEVNKVREKYADLRVDYEKVTQERDQYAKTITDLQNHEKAELERLEMEAQLKLDREILEMEKKYQEQIEKLKSERQEEIDKYQQKYLGLLEQMKGINDN